MQQIRNAFPSPEHIDDNESPAMRICSVFLDYRKAVAGSLIASRIGLDAIARECGHFRGWLEKLRKLA